MPTIDLGLVTNSVKGRNVLWEGPKHLGANETINPTKPLSKCVNGWVLVYRGYNVKDSVPYNWGYWYYYINKNSFTINTFHYIGIPSVVDGILTTVYNQLKIQDTNIQGHSVNVSSTSKNTCLMYVIEY